MSKKISLLTLASEATEITIDGHLFCKENGKWKIWFKLQNLVYQAITEKSEDRTRYKIGLRTGLSGDLEIFYSEYSLPYDYVNACEEALSVFNSAISWEILKEHFEKQFLDENELEDDSSEY